MTEMLKDLQPKLNTQTTAHSLESLLKSGRDIMRKDKGFNSDLDRLPMLTWMMFLKFFHNLECQRKDEAKLAGKKLKAAVEPPIRWRDRVGKSGRMIGDELKFTLPDLLKVPPISQPSNVNEIIGIFGGAAQIRGG